MISIALFVARGLYLCGPSRSAAVSYDILLFFSDQHQPRPLRSHTSPPIGNNFIDSSLCSSTLVMWRGSVLRGRLLPLFCKSKEVSNPTYLSIAIANKFLTTAIRIRIVCYLILVWSNVLQTIQRRQLRLCIIVAAGDK